ncbi:hypothetical protein [Tenacibaculum sp. MAR_2009_124]|uniref:hypothetical protein n=1 Tax=Tenacibaculum sp. MAR_2009_124 TaxID=1250059 RepID=UPI000B88C342|nr:hypothetical protein [Tenacibaculum sp. MAR_2009_124]
MNSKTLRINIFTSVLIAFLGVFNDAKAQKKTNNYDNEDFQILHTQITHNKDLGVTIWEIRVNGEAGKTKPKAKGQLDGAPVLGYVFPTSLKSADVGFNDVKGIVALALTSHPDFDDTPLWDEDMDGDPKNKADGLIWHPHWVVLKEDKRVAGGLSVKQFVKEDDAVILPATNPGMPMYMDSPGFPVKTIGQSIKVIVPDYRIKNKTSFSYDGVAAYMMVNTSKTNKPMLGVYKVYSIASGNLSLPYKVIQK